MSAAVDVFVGEHIDSRSATARPTDAFIMWVAPPAGRLRYDAVVPDGLIRGTPTARGTRPCAGTCPFPATTRPT